MTTTTTPMDWPAACEASAADWRAGRDRIAYELTEDAYYWGLECVFPAAMRSTAYLCGEPAAHDDQGRALYDAAVRTGGKFYHLGRMTVEQLNALTMAEIKAAIQRGGEA